MIFIETTLFTKQLNSYLTDEQYRNLQGFLLEQPDAGKTIQGTGGLRKLRWSANSHGKRGGVRIIYYWKVSEEHIYLMALYAKNEVSDLSAKEKKALKQMLEDW
jgi:hypothetical protein